MNKIIPAILEKDENIFCEKIDKLAGLSSRIHIDLIDEEYGNKSLEFNNWGNLDDFETVGVHLMTKTPIEDLENIPKLNKGIVYGHIEKMDFFENFVSRCKEKKLIAGMAIDLVTKIENINRLQTKLVRRFLLLSVRAGFSGQMFNISVLGKIKLLREIVGNNAEIVIDGGINFENGRKCLDAGADCLVVNSFLWSNFEENFKKLKSL